MPGDPVQVVTYDDFSGGEYGSLNQSAAANQFHGNNVMVYANGMIGPRPGLRDVTPTGMPTGPIRLLLSTPVSGRTGLFIVGGQCYYFDLYSPGVAPTAFGDPLNGNDSYPIFSFQQGVVTYITIPGDRSYALDVAAGAVVELTDSPGGSSIVIYGERMVVAGDYNDNTNRRRVFYSDAADYNSWPVENFFDVGDPWQITALQVRRQGLVIYKRENIWLLTGVPGVNATLRPIVNSQGPLWQWQVALGQNDESEFIPVFQTKPAIFTGTDIQDSQFYLNLLTSNLDIAPGVSLPIQSGIGTSRGDRSLATFTISQGSSLDQLLIKHNQVWTYHTADVELSGLVAADGPQVILSSGDQGIYVTSYELGRPAFAEDNAASPGDGSTTPPVASFNMPEFWTEDGQDLTVRRIDVDFIKWDVGTGGDNITNHFDLRTEALGYENNDGRFTSLTYSFDQDQAESAHTLAGTPGRFIARLGDDSKMAPGFQLFIENIRGCWIRRIKIWCELHPNVSRY